MSTELQTLVSSHGYSDATVFFVAGFPLKPDLANGAALTGSNENELSKHCKNAGFNLAQCYRSTFIKEQLSYSGVKTQLLQKALKELGEEKYTHYEKLLFEEIRDVNPYVVVPLDDIALGAVFPHIKKLKKPRGRKWWVSCYRGSVLKLREDWQNQISVSAPIAVIPTFGPQLTYIDQTVKHILPIDYSRIKRYSVERVKTSEPGVLWICRAADQFYRFIDRNLAKKPAALFTDVETWGSMLTCASFCFAYFEDPAHNEELESVSVPIMDKSISPGEAAFLWKLMAKALSGNIATGGQNFKYDVTIYQRHNFQVTNVVHDTMLKAAMLYAEFPKGLDFLTSIYTEIPYYKDEGKEFDPKLGRDKLYFYNAKDSLATALVSMAQDKELEEAGMKELYFDEVAPLIVIYKDMDERRMRIDMAQKEKLLIKYENKLAIHLKVLRNLVRQDDFNPHGSSKDSGRVIYEELKLPKRMKLNPDTGKKAYRTDKDTLDDLLIHFCEGNLLAQQVIQEIILCRKIMMVLQYINTPLYPDNTFGSVSNIAGTETGRTSYSKTLDEVFTKDGKLIRVGRSFQTISKHGFTAGEDTFNATEDRTIAADLRTMFVPRRGYCFVEIDGSQAEARVVAVLAEDYELLAAFDQKPKIHAKTAAAIFGIDAKDIGKDSPVVPKIGIPYYDLGKRLRHAGNYDMGEFRLAQMTHLSLNECRQHLAKFHGNEPSIRNVFHHGITDFVRHNRHLITPFKRRRVFFEEVNESFFKSAIAYIPQSTVSDQTKFTLPRIKAELPGVHFLIESHDGILAEIPLNEIELYASTGKRLYERPINFKECTLSRDFDLSIPVEIGVMKENWADVEEVKI